MLTFISVIHILAALILIGLVLAQDSKSGGMGMLGGGSSSVFGASGGANILVKATRTVAIVFAATCIGLTIMSANSTKSVIDSLPASVATDAAQNAPAADMAAPKDTAPMAEEAPAKEDTSEQ
ncbi:MAG: preprotein translocase subunit SecG [Bdellovibrionota bacterium]|nr:preprotein translocase subunit SecG [Bdellovibrionota bacterium]